MNTKALSADHPNLPNGYALAAYLDCGTQTQSGAGPAIAQRRGESRSFPKIGGPVGTAAFDPDQVEFEITGLEPDGDYVLGFTWWDADKRGRKQSVQLAPGDGQEWSTVLPATLPAAFDKGESSWARILLPLPAAFTAERRFRAAFKCEAGPDAVVNELWLLRKADVKKRKRVLIVTGDDYPGHRWRETAPELAVLLREDPRLEVSITESPAIYASPLLDFYDATLLHFKDYAERMPLDAAVGAGLENSVTSGKGLVIVHFGCGAFQEWGGFVNVAGRVWNPEMRAHDPYGAFEVRMRGGHPVTEGMADFTTEDELYTCLDGAPPITVLCEATSKVDGKAYAVGFVPESGKGRVFHCTLGHDVKALEAPGVRALYRRAAAWAAGLTPAPEALEQGNSSAK